MKILLIEDTYVDREHIKNLLGKAGHEVVQHTSAEDALALDAIEIKSFDMAIVDMRLPGMDGLEAGKRLKEKNQFLNMIMLTAFPHYSTAIRALKESGFYDYVEKQKGDDALSKIVKNISEIRTQYPPDELFVGGAPLFKNAIEAANIAAQTDVSILILGERGTGKELMAKYIHKKSSRSNRKLLSFDCGAVTESIEGDELFGHEKYAFTDAKTQRIGLFEAAKGGTLFMDEIGNMRVSLQKKLERTFQESAIRRIGGNEEITMDVRLIFATNKDLKQLINEGLFLQDFYDRINAVSIEMPPLRQRQEDICPLANFFLTKYNSHYKGSPHALSMTEEAYRALESHGWPGNVRELENAIKRAVALSSNSKVITVSDLKLIDHMSRGGQQTTGTNHKWWLADKQLGDMQKRFDGGGAKFDVAKIIFPDAENPLNSLHGFFQYKYIIDYFIGEKEDNVRKKIPDILDMIVNDYKAVVRNCAYPEWMKRLALQGRSQK